jgi:hypothetical protein
MFWQSMVARVLVGGARMVFFSVKGPLGKRMLEHTDVLDNGNCFF